MIASLLLAFAFQASAPPADPTIADPTITVTGRRIAAEYEACANGGCPPARDANATLAFAQQQLLAGKYRDSRRALQAAIRRNAGAAETHPLALSALYDADSTLALHLGEQDDSRRSGLKAVALLRDGYGPGDPRAIAARVRIGDVEAKLGRNADADRAYRAAADEARRAGLPMLADAIDLRRAYQLAARGQALAAQNRLVRYADDAASNPRLRTLAAVLAARVARDRHDDPTADRMLGLVGRQPANAKPMLVSAPDIALASTAAALAQDEGSGAAVSVGLQPTSSDLQPLRWIDVGFWVRPDGGVEEVEILRGSVVRSWAKPVLRAVEGRRYAPADAAPGDPGQYRIERYTLTAEVIVPKGSLIARRAGSAELRWLDITDDPERKESAQLPAS